jgi:hypothetical protein
LPHDVFAPRIVVEQPMRGGRRNIVVATRAIDGNRSAQGGMERIAQAFAVGCRPFIVDRREQRSRILRDRVRIAAVGDGLLERQHVDLHRHRRFPGDALDIGIDELPPVGQCL